MTQETPRNHDHSSRGSGGGEISPGRSQTTKEPMANVKAYGAAGDGSTDDGDAIQSAVSAEESAVYLPPGDYAVSGTVQVPADTAVMFDDRADVIRTAAGDVFDVSSSPNVTFLNPRVDGGGLSGHAIYASNADDITIDGGHIRNTEITGSESVGVLIQGSKAPEVSGVRVSEIGATWGAIRVEGSSDAEVSGCYVEETRHHGISFIGTDTAVCTGNVVRRNGWKDTSTGGTGIHSDTGSRMNWTGNSVIDPHGGGIKTQTDGSVVSSNLVKRTNSAEAAGIIIGNPSCLVSSNRVTTDTDVRGIRILSDDAYVVGNKIEATGASTMVGVTLEGNNNSVVWNDVQGFSSNYNDTGTGNYRFDRLSKDFGAGSYANHAASPRAGERAYFSESVGQSSVELGRAGKATAAMYLVQGEDPAGDRYADLLLATFSSVTTVASISDGAIGRTYTVSSNTLSGVFDSGSSDGDMQVFGWGV